MLPNTKIPLYCLLHLSNREWNRLKNNSFHLAGLQHGKVTSYSKVTIGPNIVAPLKKSTSGDTPIFWKEINLSQTKGTYCCFTTTIDEISDLVDNQKIILIDSFEGSSKSRAFNDKASSSGVVLLSIMHLDKKNHHNRWSWGNAHWQTIKSCKNNIMTKTNRHHDSRGGYYSYGNKGFYGLIGNSSVSQYTIKNSNSHKNQLKDHTIESMMSIEINTGVKNLMKILPIIPKVISPIIDTAHGFCQSTSGNINIKETGTSEYGIWQSSICVNPVTHELHVEEDVTYTILCVPAQEKVSKTRKYHFLIQLHDKLNISLPMVRGTTVMFSSQLLAHRQSCNVVDPSFDELHINFSCYGNKRLFKHIRQSIIRSSNLKK